MDLIIYLDSCDVVYGFYLVDSVFLKSKTDSPCYS